MRHFADAPLAIQDCMYRGAEFARSLPLSPRFLPFPVWASVIVSRICRNQVSDTPMRSSFADFILQIPIFACIFSVGSSQSRSLGVGEKYLSALPLQFCILSGCLFLSLYLSVFLFLAPCRRYNMLRIGCGVVGLLDWAGCLSLSRLHFSLSGRVCFPCPTLRRYAICVCLCLCLARCQMPRLGWC